MSYGFMVKSNDEIPLETLEHFEIPLNPVIFHLSVTSDNDTKQFVLSMSDYY